MSDDRKMPETVAELHQFARDLGFDDLLDSGDLDREQVRISAEWLLGLAAVRAQRE